MWSLTVQNPDQWLWHLHKIQAHLAWDITRGDPNIKIAIIDTNFDIEHPDLFSEIEPHFDPYTGYPYSCIESSSNWYNHGTVVASFASAETTEQGNIPQGQLASIGFNTKIVGYLTGSRQTVLAKALHASNAMGASVINSCAGGSLFCWPDPNSGEDLIVKEILNNGTLIVMPAGNRGTNNSCGPLGNQHPFYPFHPSYDERIIIVTSTDKNDYHFYNDPITGNSYSHSHFPEVDICAPGYGIMGASVTRCGNNNWPYFGSYGGTSFSSPIVAGACALIKSLNPDFTPAEIKFFIKSTADPIVDEQNFSGLLGAGRINAFKAIEKANNLDPIIVSSDEIWDNDRIIVGELRVINGAELVISTTVQFSKRSYIIIDKGSKLIILGGKLTNLDNSPWRGIYVVGDRTKPQTFENQGAVIMENGAVIENSEYGVRLRGFGEAWHTNGGIIQATNSTFRNNWRNVEFMNYKNTNGQGQEIPTISYFTNCNFITDEQTLHNVHWGNVTIWDVNGVNFTGCNFIDERQNLDFQAYRQARDGIYTISAGFSVNNSNFEGLKYGIHSTTEVPNRTFSVNNSTFSTYRGIYFNAIDNAFIVGNTFNIAPGYTYAGQRCADTYGIYIDNSSMFTVENNVLSSSSTGNTTCGSLGLIARNTGIFQNEIYRNTFSNFTIGIEAIGKNRGENLGSGLQIKCNIFYDNAYDIFVVPGTQSKPEGIRQLQGYAGSPSTSTLAGNLFGNNSPILISNFVNQCANISYFHHNVQSEPRVKPAIYSSKIFFYESPDLFYNYEASCPAKTRSESYPELLAEKQNAHSLFETTSQQLQDMVDQGNTEMTTQQVEMANTGDAWYTYQSLMQTSPYLSDQVLTALGAKEEGFNKAMIRDVMLINPQTAKSEAVQEALDARADQLPAYMRWQIDNGLFHFGQKEIAEQFMAYQKTRHDQALNQIIQGIVHERAGFGNAPAVEALLAQTNDIRYQYLLAELQFSKSDFTTGNQLLSQIEQSFDITHEEAWQAHQDYLDFYALLAQWPHADYPGYSGLPEEALQQLEGYLEATPRVAGKALSLLMLNHAIEYEEPILYPSEEVEAMSAPILPPAPFLAPGESESELKFALFPSPAREYITLSWCLETDREIKGNIEFRDARGLLVFTMPVHQACDQQILPLSGWKSGAYTATISLGAGFRKSISFVVSR